MEAIPRYNPSDFDPFIPTTEEADAIWRRQSPSMGTRQNSTQKIAEGAGRDNYLTSIAGSLRRRGASQAAVRAAITAENQARCDPPLPDTDIDRITGSVCRYAPDSDAEQATGKHDDKPRLFAQEPDLSLITRQAWDAMLSVNEPPRWFRQSCIPTRIEEDDDGHYIITELTQARLRHEMAEIASWYKLDKGNERPAHPPIAVISNMLARPNIPLPVIERIVTCPVFSAHGNLFLNTGYNPETHLYHESTLELTEMSIDEARDTILNDLLGDFPFADVPSLAHTVAFLLLPLVRPMVDGSTPLHLFDSPMPGTGKGLLARICCLVAIGREPATTPAGKDDEEWRKRITAQLLAGASHIAIDNVTTPIDSGVLASALTEPLWSDRILGRSQQVQLPNRAIWSAAGNNIQTSQEIARRSLWIRLDSNSEKPWTRDAADFTHPDIEQWVRTERPRLISAAVSLIQAWIQAGRKPFSGRAKGSYGPWSRVIGGILEHSGIPGFLDNDTEFFDVVAGDNDVFGAFVETWESLYGEEPTETSILFRLASHPDDPRDGSLDSSMQWRDLLTDLLGAGNQASRSARFGKLLANKRGVVVAGCKIEKAQILHGRSQWRLSRVVEKTSTSTQDQGGGGWRSEQSKSDIGSPNLHLDPIWE